MIDVPLVTGGNSSTSSNDPMVVTPSTTNTATNRADSVILDIWEAEITLRDRALRQIRARNSRSVTGYNYVYALNSGVLPNPPPSTVANEPSGSRGIGGGGGGGEEEGERFLPHSTSRSIPPLFAAPLLINGQSGRILRPARLGNPIRLSSLMGTRKSLKILENPFLYLGYLGLC